MFEDNRGEFPVTIVIELPPGPANSTDVLDIQNYLNDFGPYGSFSAVVPPLIVVFEPNGMVANHKYKETWCHAPL